MAKVLRVPLTGNYRVDMAACNAALCKDKAWRKRVELDGHGLAWSARLQYRRVPGGGGAEMWYERTGGGGE